MAEAYSYEIRDTAEEMYVEQGLTYEQIVEALKVGRNTLLKWGAEREWKSRREEYCDANGTLRASLVKLRQKMIMKAIKSTEPQDVYAVSSIVNAMKATKASDAIEGVPTEIGTRQIRTAQDAVDALQEAIETKIRLILASPATVDLKTIKDMKEAMRVIDEMKVAIRIDDGAKKPPGVSPETIEKIRRDVLRMG
uniref:Uncharacterized protein n=1 Tax=viral metagenome TaxID=1070528 RepID=A0A6M3IT31_9ZZZZ